MIEQTLSNETVSKSMAMPRIRDSFGAGPVCRRATGTVPPRISPPMAPGSSAGSKTVEAELSPSELAALRIWSRALQA